MKVNEAAITPNDKIGNENEELIRKLLQKGILQLNPTLDKTAVHYLEAESAWNTDFTNVKLLLDALENGKFLKSEPLDWVLTCPHCSSPEMHSKYACPRCKSDNVAFTELLEHIKCGNIGSKDTFMKGSSLICPRCQTVLVEGGPDNRVIGNFYQCEKCGHRFDRPDVIHVCMNCGTLSTHQTALYSKVFRFTIPDEIVQELQRELPVLKNLKSKLAEIGFSLQTHARIKGVSGAESVFDIFAEIFQRMGRRGQGCPRRPSERNRTAGSERAETRRDPRLDLDELSRGCPVVFLVRVDRFYHVAGHFHADPALRAPPGLVVGVQVVIGVEGSRLDGDSMGVDLVLRHLGTRFRHGGRSRRRLRVVLGRDELLDRAGAQDPCTGHLLDLRVGAHEELVHDGVLARVHLEPPPLRGVSVDLQERPFRRHRLFGSCPCW